MERSETPARSRIGALRGKKKDGSSSSNLAKTASDQHGSSHKAAVNGTKSSKQVRGASMLVWGRARPLKKRCPVVKSIPFKTNRGRKKTSQQMGPLGDHSGRFGPTLLFRLPKKPLAILVSNITFPKAAGLALLSPRVKPGRVSAKASNSGAMGNGGLGQSCGSVMLHIRVANRYVSPMSFRWLQTIMKLLYGWERSYFAPVGMDDTL